MPGKKNCPKCGERMEVKYESGQRRACSKNRVNRVVVKKKYQCPKCGHEPN